MRILAIETATDRCGVAILEDAHLVVDLLLTRPRSHAEFLVPMIEQALAFSRLRATDLNTIAVSMGPGSYTGLRIGVSTAKGLAYATGASLVGIPSLQALALAVARHAAPGDHILTTFAARREELYASLWRVDETGDDWDDVRLTEIGETAAVPLSELSDWLPPLSNRLILTGDGAAKAAAAMSTAESAGPSSARDPQPPIPNPRRHLSPILPSAAAVAYLANSPVAPPTADLASFEPHYLKEFVAKKPKRTIFDRLPF